MLMTEAAILSCHKKQFKTYHLEVLRNPVKYSYTSLEPQSEYDINFIWNHTKSYIWIASHLTKFHYIDVIMTTLASQITSLTVVYSTVCSDADQRKHQSSASLAFVWGIHRDRWIPRTKGQLRGNCFHLMTSSCWRGNSFPCHIMSSLWLSIFRLKGIDIKITSRFSVACAAMQWLFTMSIGYTVAHNMG